LKITDKGLSKINESYTEDEV